MYAIIKERLGFPNKYYIFLRIFLRVALQSHVGLHLLLLNVFESNIQTKTQYVCMIFNYKGKIRTPKQILHFTSSYSSLSQYH